MLQADNRQAVTHTPPRQWQVDLAADCWYRRGWDCGLAGQPRSHKNLLRTRQSDCRHRRHWQRPPRTSTGSTVPIAPSPTRRNHRHEPRREVRYHRTPQRHHVTSRSRQCSRWLARCYQPPETMTPRRMSAHMPTTWHPAASQDGLQQRSTHTVNTETLATCSLTNVHTQFLYNQPPFLE